MAIIKGLKEWRPQCQGAAYPLQLTTNHNNLEYFMTKKLQNRRQARWSEFSTCFNYQIVYRPGKSNGNMDASTRRPGDLPEGGDESSKSMEQVVVKPQNLSEHLHLLADSLPTQGHPSISDLIAEACETNPLPGEILEAIPTNGSSKGITIAECTEQEGRIQYQGKYDVPENDRLWVRLIQEHHDTALAGHPGRAKTFHLVDRQYYW